MDKIHDLIIIGSGPAGLTAAIYAARGSLKPLLFAGYNFGGQLMTTTDVENFPGFPEGVAGPALIDKMVKQAERFGTEVTYRDVVAVDLASHPFVVGDGEQNYQAKALIVATGARPRKLGVSGEDKYWSKGVSSCATCDGAFFKGKVVAVVGGGDSAMEEALYLTNFATKVYLIHRRSEFRASKIMQDRVRAHAQIEIILDSAITEVVGEESVSGLKLQSLTSGAKAELQVDQIVHVDGLFLAIGHIPESELFKDKLTMNELGYLLPEQNTMANIAGVFIAGDVADERYRQAITAAADGCKAAIDAQRWLETALT